MLFKFFGKYREFGLLILRVGLGVIFMIHGLPKLGAGPKLWHSLGDAMGNLGMHLFPTFWGFMAAIAEGVGGLLLILGAFYRPTALLLTFTMSIATLHLALGAKTPPFSAYSYPLTMAFVFLGLAFIGPGRLSIDKD